jgi:hypothetical protein
MYSSSFRRNKVELSGRGVGGGSVVLLLEHAEKWHVVLSGCGCCPSLSWYHMCTAVAWNLPGMKPPQGNSRLLH